MWVIWQGTQDFPNNFWREIWLLGWFDIFRREYIWSEGNAFCWHSVYYCMTFFFYLREPIRTLFILFPILFMNVDVNAGFGPLQATFHLKLFFGASHTKLILRRKQKSSVTKTNYYSVSYFCFLLHMLFRFSRARTLSTAHIQYYSQYITLLYILENTNQNKVSETDHAVTQKLSLVCLSHALSQSFEGKCVSYCSYGKICNLCLPVYERVLG